MQTHTLRCETEAVNDGTRYSLFLGQSPMPFGVALERLGSDPGFRADLTALLASSDYVAYRWETPPVTLARRSRPFEFVLMDSPSLAGRPEPEVFRPHFSAAPPEVDVLAIGNLGGNATLVVPRQISAPFDYAHLASFVRGAPEAQVHHLWQLVAGTVTAQLSSRPLWLSTAGGGVSWLHVRVEGVPKYYRHRPYRSDG